LFTGVMGAGALTYVAIVLGHLLTSARAFRPQAPLLAVVAAASAAASWLSIPKIGLAGAAAAIALGACVQIGGSLAILRRLEARRES
jgi:O-antigen/teichoic acid export membrane protein